MAKPLAAAFFYFAILLVFDLEPGATANMPKAATEAAAFENSTQDFYREQRLQGKL